MWFGMNIFGAKNLTGRFVIDAVLRYLLIRFFRPKAYVKSSAYPEDSDDEVSTVGKMPPSDSEDE